MKKRHKNVNLGDKKLKTSEKKTQKCKFKLKKDTKMQIQVTKSHKLVRKSHKNVNLGDKKLKTSKKKIQKCKFRQ